MTTALNSVPDAPPRNRFQREASRARFSSPAAVGAAIVLVLAARWIWVAGLGDYGWDYEIAARILRGEVFFRDFFLLRSPLSYYTLAAWMRVLGDHLVVFQLHLWFSYVLALVAGLLVARELRASPPALITGASLAAVLGCPVFSWAHALDYQSVFLAGIGILCTLYTQQRSHAWAALAGAAAALSIYFKQNVGIAIAVAIPVFLPRKALVRYMAGFLGIFALVFTFFSLPAGAAEVWRQLFTDAVSAKGGWLRTVLRAMPRLIFRPDLPLRRWWELTATVLAYAALLLIAARISRRESAEADEPHSGPRSGTGLACLVGVCLAVAFSLLRLDFAFPAKPLIHPWLLLFDLIYIFFFLLSITYCVYQGDRRWVTALLLTLAVTAAEEASNPNFVYSVPLLVPLLCALLARSRLTLRPAAAGAVVAAAYLLGTTVVGPADYYGLCAYQPTYLLPPDSPFRGLRAPAQYADMVHEMWQQARPILRNRRTLWLLGRGGPYLAYGGLPVPNVPYYGIDSVPARLDRRLIESWQNDPPEAVVLEDFFHPSPRSDLLTADYVKKHVLSAYSEVWRSKTDPPVGLWLLQRAPNERLQ